MPECSLEFLLETTSWGVVLIHFNFLSISLLSFHLPPEGELMVISGSGYKPRMTWGCLLCTVPVRGCPHSRSPGGRKGSWRPGLQLRESMRPCQKLCFSCGTEQWSFKLTRDPEKKKAWALGDKFSPPRHISGAVWNKSNKWALLSWG